VVTHMNRLPGLMKAVKCAEGEVSHAGGLVLLGLAYAVYPSHPNLRAFDPGGMARSETAMWRHYYEHRYLWLFADLYGNSRSQYGSPRGTASE
jgi:hypothetical protein